MCMFVAKLKDNTMSCQNNKAIECPCTYNIKLFIMKKLLLSTLCGIVLLAGCSNPSNQATTCSCAVNKDSMEIVMNNVLKL